MRSDGQAAQNMHPLDHSSLNHNTPLESNSVLKLEIKRNRNPHFDGLAVLQTGGKL